MEGLEIRKKENDPWTILLKGKAYENMKIYNIYTSATWSKKSAGICLFFYLNVERVNIVTY